jgi:hypothetical protein
MLILRTLAIKISIKIFFILANLILSRKDILKPESFNMNISHQLFDCTITFVNPQHYITNSKDLVRQIQLISIKATRVAQH